MSPGCASKWLAVANTPACFETIASRPLSMGAIGLSCATAGVVPGVGRSASFGAETLAPVPCANHGGQAVALYLKG